MIACVNCRWFVHEDDGCRTDEGTCRRHPPLATWLPDKEMGVTVWAHVDWMDWCGEFEPREEE